MPRVYFSKDTTEGMDLLPILRNVFQISWHLEEILVDTSSVRVIRTKFTRPKWKRNLYCKIG